VRINYGIKICTELSAIDPRGSCCGIGNSRARYKSPSPNGSQFSDRCAVSANNDCSSGFYLA